MFWIMILAFVALMTVAILIFLSPGDQAKDQKKKEKAKANTARKNSEHKVELAADVASTVAPSKDWKAIAERWEKSNAALNAQIEEFKNKERQHLKEVETINDDKKDLLGKLELEKSWREKEQATLDKFKHHEKDLKDQIFRTESDLEKEHSHRLRLERELQDIRIKHDAIVEEKRQLAVKASSLETTLNQVNAQVKELMVENAKLKEKREDVQWVAKSSFDELQARFTKLSQEMDKLKG